jgi:hypothetical protein
MARAFSIGTSRRAFGLLVGACSAAASSLLAGDALSARPAHAEAAKDAGAEVTFCGYQALPGKRGIIFVELNELVAVEVKRSGPVVEYRLVGATVPLKNNRNPLLLGDFNVSALKAVLVPDKPAKGHQAKTQRSVKLVVTLRGQAAPTYRMVTRGKGAALEVELPPSP